MEERMSAMDNDEEGVEKGAATCELVLSLIQGNCLAPREGMTVLMASAMALCHACEVSPKNFKKMLHQAINAFLKGNPLQADMENDFSISPLDKPLT